MDLTLRTGNASDSPNDYNKDAVFEFGHYQGRPNYQVYDGVEQTDTGVAFSDQGVTETVTINGDDTYDLDPNVSFLSLSAWRRKKRCCRP